MTEYDFTKIVRDISIKQNMVDCQLENKYLTSKGDGYLGTVQAVKLVGKNQELDVVFKFSHRNPKSHENLPLRDIYLNEIQFYETIVPAFDKFQEEYHIKDRFNNVPKFYGAVTEPFNELLVLENLKEKNYDLWDRKKLITEEHLLVALETFAKFHGTSYAMEKITPNSYKSLTRRLRDDDVLPGFLLKMGLTEQIQIELKKTIEAFDGNTEKKYIDSLGKFRDNLGKEFEEILLFHDADVISQGDCWCNNAMYHYENLNDRTKPKCMKILDFQMLRLASPVMDLSYFFYTITPKKSYDNWRYFMKVYHNALRKYLEQYNLNVDLIFSFETFEKHWSKLCKFGFILSFLIRKVMLMEGENAPDITEGNFLGNIHVQQDIEKIFYQQMKDLAIHFIDNNFI